MKKNNMTLIHRITLLVKEIRLIYCFLTVIFLAGFYDSNAEISTPFILQFISFLFPIWIFFNGTDSIYDYESDKINPKKINPLSMPGTIFDSKYFAAVKESSYVSRFVLLMTGSVLEPEFNPFIRKSALFCGALVFIISLTTQNLINIFLTGVMLFFGYFYSATPFRLKNYPPMDLITLLIVFLAFYINGYTFGNPTLTDVPTRVILNLIAWSMGVLGFITLANMMDYESDKKANVKNSVVRFGMRPNAVLVFLSWLTASVLVDLNFTPLVYYIYFITAVYFSLIFFPNPAYAKAIMIFTIISYLPVIMLYVQSLAGS